MTISAKVTKGQPTQSDFERLFKLLESIDWKLWEMYQILKTQTEPKTVGKGRPAATKKTEE